MIYRSKTTGRRFALLQVIPMETKKAIAKTDRKQSEKDICLHCTRKKCCGTKKCMEKMRKSEN